MSQTLPGQSRLSYTAASALAEKIRQTLAPACRRIEIAGSIRRRSAWIGDLELVAIPIHQPGLFPGQPGVSLLDQSLDELVEAGRMLRGEKQGPRYKRFVVPGRDPGSGDRRVNVDLFIVTPATWGVQLLIRTGPADFGRRCVTRRSYGGLLRDDCRIAEGRMWRMLATDEPIPPDSKERGELTIIDGYWHVAEPTPEEAMVFEYLGIDYLEPERR
ncbi:hypothetical protein ACERK3_09525 [Phycisphaerales bacterium AB-hyl4]|uniref:Uncharacterized protein n=1 Tax=Natronomicrosphaera hydrolytica TaxID=3242702 RepID=A0ABV4U4K4_9BACT